VNAYILEMGTDTYASNRGEQTVSAPGVDLKGLVPETNYFFRLRAVNNAGEGPRSEITGFSTQPSPPVNAPEGITVMDVTSHGLTVVWTPTPDAINYEVGFGTDPAVQNAQIRSVATFSCNLTGLNPKTAYTVRVRKVNRGGNGPWSQSRTVTTAPL
jgi:titin